MSAILEQLELNHTFFVQLTVFAVLFFVLANLYFKPFLKLFEARHKRTVEDRERAERLVTQAQEKLAEYQRRVSDERAAARQDFEAFLAEAKREETELLVRARDEAKKVTQEALESAHAQRAQVQRQLEADIESLARNVSETLLRRP